MYPVNKLNRFWESRSRKYGTDPKGVLPKFLPYALLDYLDDWMYSQIKQVLPNDKKVKVLDLGCGYGRLALKITKDYPSTHITGIDISQKYVDLFNKSIGKHGRAIKRDIKKLPFEDMSFDVIIAVTTFMYLLNAKDQARALREVFRLLKHDGKFVFIERNSFGHSLITLGGVVTLLRGEKNKEIQSVGYSWQQMMTLINTWGGKTEKCSGIAFWTLLLPLEYLLSKLSLEGKFLKVVKFLDRHFNYLLTPSLYISYIGSAAKN